MQLLHTHQFIVLLRLPSSSQLVWVSVSHYRVFVIYCVFGSKCCDISNLCPCGGPIRPVAVRHTVHLQLGEFCIRSAGHLTDPGIYTKFFKRSQYLIKTLYTLGWQVCTKVFIQLVIVYTHRSSSSINRLYDTFRRWPVINYTFLWADQLFFYCTFEHYNMPYFYHN